MTLCEVLCRIHELKQDEAHDVGICGLVTRVAKGTLLEKVDLCNEFVDLYKDWPEYLGNSYYPVSDPDAPGKTGYEDYAEYKYDSIYGQMWLKSDPYGAARWRLLEWAIEESRKRGL